MEEVYRRPPFLELGGTTGVTSSTPTLLRLCVRLRLFGSCATLRFRLACAFVCAGLLDLRLHALDFVGRH